MVQYQSGTPTFHTRVEEWECDFNGHWNTRFYARAFQQAASVCSSFGKIELENTPLIQRHCRFHGELFSGELVEIRSFNLTLADGTPTIVHILTSDGNVAATALDIGSGPNSALDELTHLQATIALPRGLEDIAPDTTSDTVASRVELGLLSSGDFNPDGCIDFERLMAYIAIASSHHSATLGFTPNFSKEKGIGRMLVEMRYKPESRATAGAAIRARSALTALHSKGFITSHSIETHTGERLASFQLLSLTVDRETRRAIAPPAFMTAAMAARPQT